MNHRMKSLYAVASLALVGAVLAAAAARGPSGHAAAVSGGASPSPQAFSGLLVVHEWGTFTGFAGSDGVHLPFRTTIGLDLPGFVSNRQRQASRQDPRVQNQLLFVKAGGAVALQRMETPVLYFYTDRPRDVEVRVDFPRGLLTEFYPPVSAMGPRYGSGLGEPPLFDPATRPAGAAGPQTTRPAAAAAPEPSFLDWGRVRVVPGQAGNEAKLIPEVKNNSAYAFARDTDSARVDFTDDDGARRSEKFLFYRGLGNFSLPVMLTAKGGDRFELHDTSPAPIRSAFLIHVDGRPEVATRFAWFENIAGRREMALPRADAATDDLGEEIIRALVAEGLYVKEAHAMLATWKASWLAEPGTRVLYVVPRPVTDALLPLHVWPAADETVRVLVGRIDVLTPEQESRLSSMMSSVATSGPEGLSDDDIRSLTALGRFLPPALDRIVKLSADPAAAGQAQQLQQALGERMARKK